MRGESELDERIRELIWKLVHGGGWTEEDKREYAEVVMERTYNVVAMK